MIAPGITVADCPVVPEAFFTLLASVSTVLVQFGWGSSGSKDDAKSVTVPSAPLSLPPARGEPQAAAAQVAKTRRDTKRREHAIIEGPPEPDALGREERITDSTKKA
jgi:hypothetical protein